MKKYFLLLFMLIVTITMNACGNNSKLTNTEITPTSEPVATEAPEPTESMSPSENHFEEPVLTLEPTQSVETDGLEVRAVNVPSFTFNPDAIQTIHPLKDAPDITTTIYDTILDFNKEDLLNAISNNQYLADDLRFSKGVEEYLIPITYTDIGGKYGIELTDKVFGYRQNTEITPYSYDFCVSANRQTYRYTNYNGLTIRYDELKTEDLKKVQKSIYELLSNLINTELSEFMVYGQDLDNKKVNGKVLDSQKDLSEDVQLGFHTYRVIRTLDDKNNLKFTISLLSDYSVKNDEYQYFSYEYVTIYKNFKYNLFDFVDEKKFGTTNNIEYLFDDFIKFGGYSEYEFSSLDTVHLKYTELPDSREYYEISTEVSGSQLLLAPSLEIDLEFFVSNDEIINAELQLKGHTERFFIPDNDAATEALQKECLTLSQKYVSLLFPDADVSNLEEDKSAKQSYLIENMNGELDIKTYTKSNSMTGVMSGHYELKFIWKNNN